MCKKLTLQFNFICNILKTDELAQISFQTPKKNWIQKLCLNLILGVSLTVYEISIYRTESDTYTCTYLTAKAIAISTIFSTLNVWCTLSDIRYKHEVLIDNDPVLYEIMDTSCPKVRVLSVYNTSQYVGF